MEEENLFPNLVFCPFFPLFSKYFPFHTEKRSLRNFCCGVNAFCLQSVGVSQILHLRHPLFAFVDTNAYREINPLTPAGISLAESEFHARSAFHKSRKGFISLRSVLKGTTLMSIPFSFTVPPRRSGAQGPSNRRFPIFPQGQGDGISPAFPRGMPPYGVR